MDSLWYADIYYDRDVANHGTATPQPREKALLGDVHICITVILRNKKKAEDILIRKGSKRVLGNCRDRIERAYQNLLRLIQQVDELYELEPWRLLEYHHLAATLGQIVDAIIRDIDAHLTVREESANVGKPVTQLDGNNNAVPAPSVQPHCEYSPTSDLESVAPNLPPEVEFNHDDCMLTETDGNENADGTSPAVMESLAQAEDESELHTQSYNDEQSVQARTLIDHFGSNKPLDETPSATSTVEKSGTDSERHDVGRPPDVPDLDEQHESGTESAFAWCVIGLSPSTTNDDHRSMIGVAATAEESFIVANTITEKTSGTESENGEVVKIVAFNSKTESEDGDDAAATATLGSETETVNRGVAMETEAEADDRIVVMEASDSVTESDDRRIGMATTESDDRYVAAETERDNSDSVSESSEMVQSPDDVGSTECFCETSNSCERDYTGGSKLSLAEEEVSVNTRFPHPWIYLDCIQNLGVIFLRLVFDDGG